MQVERLDINGVKVAVISRDEMLIRDAQSALELAMSVKHRTGADRFVIPKRAVCEDFFILSTGLAGEVLQKLTNYHMKAAFYGDYSRYTSKPLHDFIYESNMGGSFYFLATKDEAIKKLSEAR